MICIMIHDVSLFVVGLYLDMGLQQEIAVACVERMTALFCSVLFR